MAVLENEHFCSDEKGYLFFFPKHFWVLIILWRFSINFLPLIFVWFLCVALEIHLWLGLFFFVCMFCHWTHLFSSVCIRLYCLCAASFSFALSFSCHESSPLFLLSGYLTFQHFHVGLVESCCIFPSSFVFSFVLCWALCHTFSHLTHLSSSASLNHFPFWVSEVGTILLFFKY